MHRSRDEYDARLEDLMAAGSGTPSSDPAAELDVQPPADLPPEHADAWRQGYVRARTEAAAGQDPGPRVHAPADEPPPTPHGVHSPHATHLPAAVGPPPGPRRRAPLIVGLAALAVLLVVGAFGVGRLVAPEPDGAPAVDGSSAREDAAADGEARGDGDARGEGPASSAPPAAGRAPRYRGPVDAVAVTGSSASCQSGDSVDGAGNPTRYPPAHAHDADLSTAWRCDGRGRGERLTLRLPSGTTVAEVGLVPGYAKTDPVSGVDRYAQNNRITRVRWHLGDGRSVVQRVSGAADDRSMRTIRVPRTRTDRVVLEVLASRAGPRNTIAVSEVRIAEPAR
jgi:hypothetical protein